MFASVFVAGLVLRLWDLGSRAMHGDEAVHAWFAWKLFTGQSYAYDPVYHGPLQFPLTDVFFFLFGVSEVSGRMLSVLCGAALVGMPFFLRRYMGRAEALVASAILAFSPAFVFVSRLERDDSILALCTMIMAVAILGFVRTRQPRYLYLLGAAAALSLSAFEATYISLFIFGSYLLVVIVTELALKSGLGYRLYDLWLRTGSAPSTNQLVLPAVLALALLAFLITVLTGAYPPVPLVMVVLAIALVHRQAVLETADGESTSYWGALLSVRRVVWLNTATIVVAILVLMYSTFGTNLNGLWDSAHPLFGSGQACQQPVNGPLGLSPCRKDIFGGLVYWLSQHGYARGGQPWFYYTILFALYEQLIVIFGVGGIIWSIRRPTLFRSFVVYWAIWSFAIYSWAGEKFPWLVIHPLLPFTLLAAMFIVQAARSVRSVRYPVLAVVGLLALLELHSTYELNFVHGADVQDMMVYTTSMPDTPIVAQQILDISNKVTNGNQLKVSIDSQDTWPFAWYLRDLPNASYPAANQLTQPPYSTNPVQIIDATDRSLVATRLAKDYTSREYGLRWSLYPENYKLLDWSSFFSDAVNPGYWNVVTQWLINRRPMADNQVTSFYLYIKKGLVTPY